MTTPPFDDLVRAVLPTGAIPAHLAPHAVLDPDFEPAPRHSPVVLALRELIARGHRLDELGPKLASSRDVSTYFLGRLGRDRVESIAIVGLNARLRVMFHRVVSRGGVASCPVRIADLLRPLILNAAHGAVLVHNHPSGDPTPSNEDIELTRRVYDSCEMLGIRLLDHVIVSSSSSFSFADAGLLER